MVEKGLGPDGYTCSCLISAFARSWMVGEGEQIHGRVLSSGYCSNVFVGASLVNLYCLVVNVGGFASAYKVVDEMPERNVETWNTLLAGYRIFKEMPSRSTVSWMNMNMGFAKHSFAEKAVDVFEWIKNSGEVKPDAITFIGVLSACSHVGNSEIAYHAARNLTAVLEEDQIVDYLVPVSNVLAVAKRWQEFAIVRRKVGSQNTAGRSWIQINGTTHDFVAGDSIRENASLICDMLNRLIREMG
ncbi:hypothetical protein Cgig2_017794 [Carnegiea gigantea]|uniref:Pentatricopeptide repeat-containing protein n=1 Tax=Carnegiea gigantea TaxID=171969 RepID=A0A9Q1KXK3_9CARY|nr:hypothetical protein Cgig2_017794 [Carnegiea gigantea]